ncbi:hypothetical protein LINGRAPRIM_LOCUS2665 [Linum grandiflorum]
MVEELMTLGKDDELMTLGKDDELMTAQGTEEAIIQEAIIQEAPTTTLTEMLNSLDADHSADRATGWRRASVLHWPLVAE